MGARRVEICDHLDVDQHVSVPGSLFSVRWLD
jgi:hypothetical protein